MSLIPDVVPYLPLLEIKPAEMAALEELPEKDKDLLLPVFKLKPWVGSHELSKSLDRMAKAYGNRRAVLELSEADFVKQRRPVHDALDALRSPNDGYEAWVEFLRSDANGFIPSVQIVGELPQVASQIEKLYALGRGVCLRFDRAALGFAGLLIDVVKRLDGAGRSFLFVIDLDAISAQTLSWDGALAMTHAQQLIAKLPEAKVAVSGSSFPTSFVGLTGQSILERQLHEHVQSSLGRPIIYSDHASARIEVQRGGGGVPAPRIDYAGPTEWSFFREDSAGDDRAACYGRQALRCLRSSAWDSRLMLWGKQMIERTAYGDEGAISSPPKATAARINIHLHQQLFFGNQAGLYDTDEDWSD